MIVLVALALVVSEALSFCYQAISEVTNDQFHPLLHCMFVHIASKPLLLMLSIPSEGRNGLMS